MVEEKIAGLIDRLPSFIIIIIFGISFIIYLVDHIQVFFDTFKFIWDIINKYVFDVYWVFERKRYNKALMTTNYTKWQTLVIKKLYADLLDEFRTEHGLTKDDIHITNLVIDDGESEKIEQEYESFTWKMKNVPYPFNGICDKNNLTFLEKTDFKRLKDYLYRDGKIDTHEMHMIKSYDNLVKRTIHFPKRIGYMLDKLEYKNEKITIAAHVGTYKQNVLQSHILEYELYLFYRRYFKRNKNWEDKLKEMSKEEILEHLFLRRRIHEAVKKESKESDIFCSGAGRDSLLSVQIMVLAKNLSGKYDCLRIRRSENVAAKAGYIQLIPSGGFEALNSDMCREAQWSNYSLNKVLFRELAEECFGLEDDEKNDKKSPEAIYYHKDISKITAALMSDTPTVQYEFLGIAENLVGLRPELCFLMKIDDSHLVSEVTCNEESDKQIHFVDICNMEKNKFWKYTKDGKTYDDLVKFNCTSAALFELARSSDIYKSCL